MNDLARFTIRVNRELVLLDEGAYERGEFKKMRESLSEQCEDCAKDINESGKLSKDRTHVVCNCGSEYLVRDHGA